MFQTRKIKKIPNQSSSSEGLIESAAKLAYDTYLSFLDMIKDDTCLVEVQKVDRQNITNRGTVHKIHFKIKYIPNGSKIECKSDILENRVNSLNVLAVLCDCCLEWDALRYTT